LKARVEITATRQYVGKYLRGFMAGAVVNGGWVNRARHANTDERGGEKCRLTLTNRRKVCNNTALSSAQTFDAVPNSFRAHAK